MAYKSPADQNQKNRSSYHNLYDALQVEYQQAQNADPFGADMRLVHDVPRLNQAADCGGLLKILRELVADGPKAATPPEAWAAIRDLGFVMGPIKRRGVQPVLEVPKLGHYLLQLSECAACLHPRDNVFTLTVANPTDERRRTYTNSPSEYAFIEAVGVSMVTMDRCIADICTMLEHPLHSPHFEAWAKQAADTFQAVIDALLSVRTKVDPDWFANIFTRNLEQIEINGQSYHGPSADQTQMLLIDWMLYGQSESHYVVFFDSLQQHLRPIHRQIMSQHRQLHGGSLLEIVRRNYAQSLAIDAEQTDRSVQSIIRLLKRIRTFRYPHRKIAIDSFAMRDENRQIGSGGLTPDSDLRKLIDWTEQAIAEFRAIKEN